MVVVPHSVLGLPARRVRHIKARRRALLPAASSVFLNNEDVGWKPSSPGLKFQSAEGLRGSLGWYLSLK